MAPPGTPCHWQDSPSIDSHGHTQFDGIPVVFKNEGYHVTHQSDSKLCNQLEKDCWYLAKKTRPLFLHFVHLGISWSANLRACKSSTAGIRATYLSVWLRTLIICPSRYWPYLAYLPGKPFPTSPVLQIMLRPRHLPNGPIPSPSHTYPNWSILLDTQTFIIKKKSKTVKKAF